MSRGWEVNVSSSHEQTSFRYSCDFCISVMLSLMSLAALIMASLKGSNFGELDLLLVTRTFAAPFIAKITNCIQVWRPRLLSLKKCYHNNGGSCYHTAYTSDGSSKELNCLKITLLLCGHLHDSCNGR